MLTETQIAALERKRDDDVVSGEIETAHPGYLGSQDTFYVGNMWQCFLAKATASMDKWYNGR